MTDAANVVIDMSPWVEEFAERRETTEFIGSSWQRPEWQRGEWQHTEWQQGEWRDEDWQETTWQQAQFQLPQQGPGWSSGSYEDVNTLEETKGCAILDSGATVMCSSTIAAEEIQVQRLNQSEPGLPTVSTSDRRFRFADGRVGEAQTVVEQPITSGILSGKLFRCISLTEMAMTFAFY